MYPTHNLFFLSFAFPARRYQSRCSVASPFSLSAKGLVSCSGYIINEAAKGKKAAWPCRAAEVPGEGRQGSSGSPRRLARGADGRKAQTSDLQVSPKMIFCARAGQKGAFQQQREN